MLVRLTIAALVVATISCASLRSDPARYSLAEFTSFSGIAFGDLRSDVERRFGKPQSIGNQGGHFEILVYLDGSLSFGVDASSHRVFMIEFSNRAQLIDAGVPDDARVELLGEPGWRVPSRYGPPDPDARTDSGSLSYLVTSGAYRTTVQFYCGIRLLEACERIRLIWEEI